jgi:hypothetical protein
MRQQHAPHFSLVSILAIVAAVASFFVGWGAGLILAIVAIVLGAIGVILAALPSTRGGFVSVFAMLAGVVGIVAAICRLAFGHM